MELKALAALIGEMSLGEQRLMLMMASSRDACVAAPDGYTFVFIDDEFSAPHLPQASELGTLKDAVNALWSRRLTWTEPSTQAHCWVSLLNSMSFNEGGRLWRFRAPIEVAESLSDPAILEQLQALQRIRNDCPV